MKAFLPALSLGSLLYTSCADKSPTLPCLRFLSRRPWPRDWLQLVLWSSTDFNQCLNHSA